jgi:exodeoxyribonuclease-3
MDYFLTSHNLDSSLVDVKYHAQILGSDHCPVSLTLDKEKLRNFME